MLIIIFRVLGALTLLIGSVIGIIRLGTSLGLGFATLLSGFVSAIIFFAFAAILEHLQRISDNTDYIVSQLQSSKKQTTKKMSYPELGKVNRNPELLEDEEPSALEKLIRKNESKFYINRA